MGIYYILACDMCREFVYLGKKYIAGGVEGEISVSDELDKLERYKRITEELDASWTSEPPPIIYEFLKRHKECGVVRQIPDFSDEYYEVELAYRWLVWAYDYYEDQMCLVEKWRAVESKILLLWNKYPAAYSTIQSVIDAVMDDPNLNVFVSERKTVMKILKRLLSEGKLDEGFKRRGLQSLEEFF